MSWGDYYQRRDAMDQVLAHGRVPDMVPEAFDSREELALALQYRWSQHLTGQVAVALADAEHAPDVDHVEAVASAWRTTARRNPALRTLLDDYAADAGPDFGEAQRVEQRMLAQAAGLADANETAAETTRIGAAFQALIKGTPDRLTRTRTNPVEQLFRRLVASS
jgi:hypothetical protein